MILNKYHTKYQNKYYNQKIEVHGNTFDSLKEYRRYCDLSMLQKAGIITDLQRQVEIELIPAQYAEVNGKRKCVERKCSYIADFVYYENGKKVVEDTKGVKTKEYIIKRKLCLFLKGIRIKEV